MTSTPPPDTAHETTGERHYVLSYGESGNETPRWVECWGDCRECAARIASGDLAAPVETVEYRVTATTPKGERVDFTHSTAAGARKHARQYQDEWGWTDVRAESRSARTWVSGWRPVDTGGDR